jgi:hypothetical protein
MYQVTWITKENVSDWAAYEDLADVRVAVGDLSHDEDVIGWTVGLMVDGSEPEYFDYDNMTHCQKGQHITTLIDLMPDNFNQHEVAATLLAIADAYIVGRKGMAALFDHLAETCRAIDESDKTTMQ